MMADADEINEKVGWSNILSWKSIAHVQPFIVARIDALTLKAPFLKLGYSNINPEVIFAECCNTYDSLGIELVKKMGSDSPHTHLMNYYFNHIAEYSREGISRDDRRVFKKGRNVYFITFYMGVHVDVIGQNVSPLYICVPRDIYSLSCIMVTL
jgi:hypothetical protein